MKRVLFLLATVSLLFVMGCDSDSDSSLGKFSVGEYKNVPLLTATYYIARDDYEISLWGKDNDESVTSVGFTIEMSELPVEETRYAVGSGLRFCEVDVDYNWDDYTGYGAEMDYRNDTESWVSIRKS